MVRIRKLEVIIMFQSLEEIKQKAIKENKPIWQIIIEDDMKERQLERKDSFETMRQMYTHMRHADESYEKDLKSSSNCVGGDGWKLNQYFRSEENLSGRFMGRIMERAVKMGESNACMKKIVAAPTAGSCGVIPAVFLSIQERFEFPEEKMVEALFVAAGIGQVIAHRASISGAQGGCQAEIGSASAMAAGALVYLRGGTADAIIHACAIAMKSLLGLTCDPVAGLVEVPCVKRNVIGAVNAVTSADMALAGLRSFIPPDEVIDAMREIGELLPSSLKETSKAGLAVTPTACALCNKHLS